MLASRQILALFEANRSWFVVEAVLPPHVRFITSLLVFLSCFYLGRVITGGKRSEEALETLARELRARVGPTAGPQPADGAATDRDRMAERLFQSSLGLMCVHDLNGHLISINPAAIGSLGYAPEEGIGKSLRDFIAPRTHDQFEDYLKRIAEVGVDEGLMLVVAKNGTERVWMYRNVRCDEEGLAPYVLGHAQDVTEHRRSEQERRELELRLERSRFEQRLLLAQRKESLALMAGGVAHDFNNILVGIIGNAELAMINLPQQSPAWTFVEQIAKSGERAADLTRQMLAYSGKGRSSRESVDLSRLVDEMSGLLTSIISKSITVSFDFAPELPPIEADPTQLRQVVMNLVTNAAEASGDRVANVEIRTCVVEADKSYLLDTCFENELPEGRYPSLIVSDTGGGIGEDTKGTMFDPFFTTKFTGRGLGLAVVAGIVRSHGGSIKVDTELGSGTTFTVLFREAGTDATLNPVGERQSANASLGTGNVSILVVDDEEVVRKVITATLEDAGFVVFVAEDGREAIEVFQKQMDTIDLVLLDLTMPIVSGEECLRRLRELRSDVDIILMSGYDEADVTKRLASGTRIEFIQKPFTQKTLVGAAMKILEAVLRAEALGGPSRADSSISVNEIIFKPSTRDAAQDGE